MAKMFYSVGEAAEKLGMSEGQVNDLISSGQLQEFRDGDRVMLKVDQVDLLAGGDEDDADGLIPLADSADDLEPIGLASSGSGTGSMLDDDPSAGTGISIFDADSEGTEEADPAAQTQITSSTPTFPPDPAASGSGLGNIALESDDTSLGADFLDDVYGSGTGIDVPADSAQASNVFSGDSVLGESAMVPSGGDLFESAEATDTDVTEAPAMMPMVAEPYDGFGSGLVAGISVGIVVTLCAAMAFMVMAWTGQSSILDQVTLAWVAGVGGGGLVISIVCAFIGGIILRNS